MRRKCHKRLALNALIKETLYIFKQTLALILAYAKLAYLVFFPDLIRHFEFYFTFSMKAYISPTCFTIKLSALVLGAVPNQTFSSV